MAATMDKPFLESTADCPVCLDLKREHLRRQWRKFSRLPALDAPYSITLKRITENVVSVACEGCSLVLRAAQEIQREFGLNFRNVVLEFIDEDGPEGLSLTLTMLHPLHTSPGDWVKAQANPDLKTSVHACPSSEASTRHWEHRISSPRYEIFIPGGEHCPAVNVSRNNPSDVVMSKREKASKEKIWSSICPRPSRCNNTAEAGDVSWTLSNLAQCSSSHNACNIQELRWSLPTRVLDLGKSSLSRLTSDVKLYVSRREQEPYLCLSHCWGTNKMTMPLETTIKNLREFQQGITWDRLTKTFQDAVVFTRRLGYRFLWIDSLCILQDDIEDWTREAGEMASIYENSVLTLAAASGSDSSSGLFQSLTPDVTLLEADHEGRSMSLRRFSNPAFFQYRAAGNGLSQDDVSPLLRRAWVFQERMLSRRVLFFTPLELVFECRASTCTESGYSWVDSGAKHAFSMAYGDDRTKATLASLWRSLVEDFTQLQLTMERDTLPAMAGLAKRFELLGGYTDNSYFAGLWKQTFVEDMLWETLRRTEGTHVRINHGIPTWSWARTRRPKCYKDRRNLMILSSLQSVACKSKGPLDDLFTSVDSGCAVLYGYLLHARSTSTGVVVDRNPRISHFPLKDYNWYEDGQDKVSDGDELFILPIAASAEGDGDMNIHCLVVRPCENTGETFTRIGIFSTSIHYLRHHEYIFEGRGVLHSLYVKDVEYGESLLGKDGLYRELKNASDKPMYMASNAHKAYRGFHSRALFLHLCLYGNKPELEFGDFFGLPHLTALRAMAAAEEERLREWLRRDERGDVQVHSAVCTRLV